MTDDRVLEYLRSRGQAAPPVGLVTSVMTAVEAAPEPRSRFAALLPAAVATGAVAIIALVGLLFGPGRDVGPPPTPTASEAAATVVELEGAVAEATERLAEADAVEG
ncbi:MAG TPA: hypothetical protein VLA76_06335, partial [Candidatus Angelobacter sp.]|nr:hypothetical protein [Candidatus Angelobacter sp.]